MIELMTKKKIWNNKNEINYNINFETVLPLIQNLVPNVAK